MKFIPVTKDNIQNLFELNKELASAEGQEALFTASLENYIAGFLGPDATAIGMLCFQDGVAIGFAVCNEKFATYLGFKTLYIEDIYLKAELATQEHKLEFLKYLLDFAFNSGYVRVEMRVLNGFNWGAELIGDLGFKKIDKWSVYRKSR